MELTTRCPECGSVFSASVEQMKRRKGYIRCVQCATIFDGFDAVVDDKASESAVAPVASAGAGFDTSVRRPDLAGLPPVQDTHFVRSGPEHEPVQAGDEAPLTGAPAVFVEPRRYRGASRVASDLAAGRYRGGSGGLGALRWVAVLLALVAAGSVLMYAFRVQIATEAPQLRPLLEKACASFDCTVEYPQRIDRISIMNSTLQVVQGNPERMDLGVVMRNTWDKPQQWPALLLELSDFSGVIVARRVFQPADYLNGPQLQGPFGAGQEIRLSQPVVIDDLPVNGFQVKKFFPQKD